MLTCLSLLSQHVGYRLTRTTNRWKSINEESTLQPEVGADCFMFMGAGKPNDRPIDDSDLAKLADVSEEWADYASRYALDVCYHIHTNTTVDSIEDWAKYMSLLRKCKLCIDVSHAALWEFDPVKAIRRYRDVLVYVHLQDYSGYTGGDGSNYSVDWVDVGGGRCDRFSRNSVYIGRTQL